MRGWGAIALAALLGACSGGVIPPGAEPGYVPPPVERPVEPHADVPVRQPIPAIPLAAMPAPPAPEGVTSAALAGVVAGPAIASLPLDDANAERALAAYKLSCRALVRRPDTSGLMPGSAWQGSCDAAQGWQPRNAARFFQQWFETVQIADGKAQATGYYEPEIAGSRDRRRGYAVPIYGPPRDFIDIDLARLSTSLKGRRAKGRLFRGVFQPYFDRTAIEEGALGGRGLEIAWAADPVELFFLQVQGSGRLRGPDGEVVRIGFAGQNGRDYTGIGALMRQRGLLAPGKASMQGIMEYLRAHPGEGRDIMRENKSYVFFKELTGAGPNGSLGLPVTGLVSAASDPRFIPLGAPVFLSMDRAEANGLWIAQDTGGAIKGPNRVDTFWGAGEDARAIAGGMNSHGTAWLFVPIGTLARLQAAGAVPVAEPVPPPQ